MVELGRLSPKTIERSPESVIIFVGTDTLLQRVRNAHQPSHPRSDDTLRLLKELRKSGNRLYLVKDFMGSEREGPKIRRETLKELEGSSLDPNVFEEIVPAPIPKTGLEEAKAAKKKAISDVISQHNYNPNNVLVVGCKPKEEEAVAKDLGLPYQQVSSPLPHMVIGDADSNITYMRLRAYPFIKIRLMQDGEQAQDQTKRPRRKV